MADDWSFDGMLADFRALGGTADNIARRPGPVGQGLFPVDPSLPVRVLVPPSLLIAREKVIFDDCILRIAEDAAGARERAFLERYYAVFSWGGDGRAGIAAFFEAMAALPPAARALLANEFAAGWLVRPASPERIEKQFLNSRAVRRDGIAVMAPIVELANHASGGLDYDLSRGVGLGGQVDGELFAAYQRWDPFQIFAGWGFASPEPLAYSLPLFVNLRLQRLVVARRLDLQTGTDREAAPPVSLARNRIVDLPYLLIGDRDQPGRPRAIFGRILQALGLPDADAVFDRILAINTARFHSLAKAVDDASDPGSSILRAVCRHQLAALGAD